MIIGFIEKIKRLTSIHLTMFPVIYLVEFYIFYNQIVALSRKKKLWFLFLKIVFNLQIIHHYTSLSFYTIRIIETPPF